MVSSANKLEPVSFDRLHFTLNSDPRHFKSPASREVSNFPPFPLHRPQAKPDPSRRKSCKNIMAHLCFTPLLFYPFSLIIAAGLKSEFYITPFRTGTTRIAVVLFRTTAVNPLLFYAPLYLFYKLAMLDAKKTLSAVLSLRARAPVQLHNTKTDCLPTYSIS